MPQGTRARPLRIAATAALVVAALVFLFLIDPGGVDFLPRCFFLSLTGYYCPGCGSMRAIHRLLHGDIAAAFALNPLMVLSLPIIAAMLTKPRWLYWRGTPWITLAVIVAYGILRNIPVWPFTLLAP